MDERWAWTTEPWRRAFGPVAEGGLTLERVDVETYWKVFESDLLDQFPPEVFFDLGGLRGDEVEAKQKRIAQARDDHALCDPCIIRDGAKVAGSFLGQQKTGDTYRMWHTTIHGDYRRRGLYKNILAGYIQYTSEIGFDKIVSEHAPGNNPVLIAKLGAGFRITGFDVNPLVGCSVHLCYFHNPDQLDAYLFRCGLATMNERILANGRGAIDRLAEQFTRK